MNAIRKINHLSELGVQINLPKGPEVIWPAIRERKGRGFTARDIARAVDATIDQAENYILRLVKAGLVSAAGFDAARERVFQTGPHVPHLPPVLDRRGQEDHTHRLTEAVWRTARMMKVFSLTLLSSQLDTSYSRDAVARYLHELEKAGYLIDLGAREPCGEKEWKVKPAFHNAGPLPPRPMMARFIYDPNRRAVTNRVLEAEEVRL